MAALKLGREFDDGNITDVLADTLQQGFSFIRQRNLPAPEKNTDLDLVFSFQKAPDGPDFCLQIMRVCFGADLDLFQMNDHLFLFCFLLFFRLLIFKSSVIHDFTDRWFGKRRYFNQVKTRRDRFGKGFVYGQNTELLTVGADYPDFLGPNVIIDIDPLLFCLSYASLLIFILPLSHGASGRFGRPPPWCIT